MLFLLFFLFILCSPLDSRPFRISFVPLVIHPLIVLCVTLTCYYSDHWHCIEKLRCRMCLHTNVFCGWATNTRVIDTKQKPISSWHQQWRTKPKWKRQRIEMTKGSKRAIDNVLETQWKVVKKASTTIQYSVEYHFTFYAYLFVSSILTSSFV